MPLHIATRDRPSMYLKRGSTITTINKAYSKMPRIRSHAHPFFVVWVASEQIDMDASSYLPEKEAQLITDAVGDIVDCWDKQPPEAFLIGPDVWRQHRHPLSDDGHDD